ncbi:MAG: RNA methyltransferase [Bacteroidota bacterium]
MRKLKLHELNRINNEEFKKAEKLPLIVVLDNIRSMNNTGSVFRTGDAFRINCLHLCGITAKPPHKDIHKTALGAEDSVNWVYFEKTIDSVNLLKKNGFKIIAIEQTTSSKNLLNYEFKNNYKFAVIFGNEINGVDQSIIDLCDDCIEIPQYGTKHSLNISVSAGIVIWEIFKKLDI